MEGDVEHRLSGKQGRRVVRVFVIKRVTTKGTKFAKKKVIYIYIYYE